MTSFIGLPAGQVRCLHTIIVLIDQTGMSPTLDEIAEAMPRAADEKPLTRQGVRFLVEELVKKGRLARDPHKHRSITVVETKKALKK